VAPVPRLANTSTLEDLGENERRVLDKFFESKTGKEYMSNAGAACVEERP
jgi:hypothetical protein